MKRLIGALTGLFLLCAPSHAALRIVNDEGGIIGMYEMKYNAVHESGGFVAIDGDCVSACTLVTGMVERDHVCITPRAKLAFHSAKRNNGPKGTFVYTREGTEAIWQHYPEDIRALLRKRGWQGNTEHSDLIWIENEELRPLFKPCVATDAKSTKEDSK